MTMQMCLHKCVGVHAHGFFQLCMCECMSMCAYTRMRLSVYSQKGMWYMVVHIGTLKCLCTLILHVYACLCVWYICEIKTKSGAAGAEGGAPS